jgi:hypothetical protein
MRRWIVVASGLAIVAVAGGAIAYAVANLDAYLERNRDWIAQQMRRSLGRDVSFDRVRVSLFPSFGATVEGLRIADDPRVSKDDFLRAVEVQVSIRLWPALLGRYEVRRIRLVRPALSVIRTAEGYNFDSLGQAREEVARPAPREAPAAPLQPPEPAGAAAALLVGLAEIRDGELRYVDRAAKPPAEFVVRALDFSAEDLSLSSPIRIRATAAILGAPKPNVSVSGTLGPFGSPPVPREAPIDLEASLGPFAIDDAKKLAAIGTAIPPELSSPDPVSVSASLGGSLGAPKVELEFDATAAALAWGEGFRKPRGTRFAAALEARRSGDAIVLDRCTVRLAGLELSAKGTVGAGPGATVDLTLDSNRAPLGELGSLLPNLADYRFAGAFEVHARAKGELGGAKLPALDGTIALAGVEVRRAGSPYGVSGLATTVEFRDGRAKLPPTKFELGGSPVELEAEIESLAARQGRFALRSPALRPASLGLAGEAGSPGEEVLRDLEVSGTFAAPPDASPSFEGKLRSASGRFHRIDYRELEGQARLRDRVVTLDRLRLQAYGGSYEGAGRYELRPPERPAFGFRSAVRGMDLRALLGSQFPGAAERISGRLDADLRLEGAGRTWEAIRPTLRGSGRVDVREGVLHDVNLADEVLGALTGMAGLSNLVSPRTRQKYPELFATGDTHFEKLGGSVVVAEGVARTEDLELSARDYSVLGRGSFALSNELDFTATFVASRALTQDVLEDLKEAKYLTDGEGRLAIPFRLAGSLPKVKVRPDAEFIARAIGRAAAERGIEKGLEKLFGKKRREPTPAGQDTQKTPEKDLLRRGLEGLFGR